MLILSNHVMSPVKEFRKLIYLFIYLFIIEIEKKKENRKIDRREQLTCTQITRNVREVTSSERVRQTY